MLMRLWMRQQKIWIATVFEAGEASLDHQERRMKHLKSTIASMKNRVDEPFCSELDLVACLERHVFSLFPAVHAILREVPTSDGVADLVVGKSISRSRIRRLRTHFRHDCFSKSCRIAIPKHRVRMEDVFSEVIAIEAKLYDWSRGLYQASRYRQFAHRCYLALGSTGVKGALRHRRAFEEANVGLIVVERDRSRVLISSSALQPYAADSAGLISAQAVLRGPRLIRHRRLIEAPRPRPSTALGA